MSNSTGLQPTKIRYLALLLLGVTATGAYLARYCISVTSKVFEGELGFTHTETGWVFAAFMVGYFFGQIPGGALGMRIGTRRAMALIIAAWSLFTVWSAFCHSLVPLIASQIAVGLAQAGLVPISSIAVKDWFPAKSRGFPSAVVASGMSVGGMVAMWLTGSLMKTWDNDWRRILICYSALGIVWSIVFYFLFRTKPAEHPWINAHEVDLISENETPAVDADTTPPSAQSKSDDRAESGVTAVLRMAASVSIWALAVQWFLRSAGYQFFARWLPAFLQERYTMSIDKSGFDSSWPLLGYALGSLAAGPVVDGVYRKTGDKWISRNALSIVSLLLCAASLAVSEFCESGEAFAGWMAIGAFFGGMSMPTGWAANIDIGGKQTPLLFALMNMSSTAAGIVAPPVVGYLMQHVRQLPGGYGTIVYLHVAIYVASAACWFLVNPKRSYDEVSR